MACIQTVARAYGSFLVVHFAVPRNGLFWESHLSFLPLEYFLQVGQLIPREPKCEVTHRKVTETQSSMSAR